MGKASQEEVTYLYIPKIELAIRTGFDRTSEQHEDHQGSFQGEPISPPFCEVDRTKAPNHKKRIRTKDVRIHAKFILPNAAFHFEGD